LFSVVRRTHVGFVVESARRTRTILEQAERQRGRAKSLAVLSALAETLAGLGVDIGQGLLFGEFRARRAWSPPLRYGCAA
jgi:hypothetical protein